MSVTVTNNMTLLFDAESTSNWTSDGGGFSTYTGFQREGTYCIGDQASKGTLHGYKTITSTNLTNVVIYMWLRSGNPDTKANGGFRIVLGDGTNRRAYYVGVSDDYGFQVGGWSCFLLDTSNLPTSYSQLAGSSAPNLSAITEVGGGFNYVTKAVGNGDNVFIDAARYISNTGYALTIGGGGVGTEGTFSDIEVLDKSISNAWGIIRKLATNVYGIQGAIEFGNSGTDSSYFLDKNITIIFEDRPIPTTYYKIKLTGNTTGTNSFVLGEKSGTEGINGCVIKSAGSSKVSLDLSDTNFNTMNIYGSTLDNIGTLTLPASSSKELITGTINKSDEVLANVTKVQYVTFISSNGRAIRMSSVSNNISDCKFIDCTHGVNIPNTGTYTFDNLIFSGEDGSTIYAIENSSTGSVIINATNGSNPQYADNTNGGTTTINNAVTLNITTKNEYGNPISNVGIRIEKRSDGTLISEGTTDANGLYSDSYNYVGDVNIKVISRKKGYKNNSAYDTITTNGLNIPFTMIKDNSVNLP